MFGFYLFRLDLAFFLKKYKRLLILVSFRSSICVCSVSYLIHRKRKCFTVSLAQLHTHQSNFVTPIRLKYPFRRIIPVCNCANILASFRVKASYNVRVYCPSKAVSISLKYFPTSSGIFRSFYYIVLAQFTSVDFTCNSSSCNTQFLSVAC